MYGHWATTINFNTTDYVGFVYLITNILTSQKYVGKKNFKVNKRATEDWKFYISSSVYLKEDILSYGKENFKFEILVVCKTKQELDEKEISIQIERNVLKALLCDGSREYYNRYIHRVGCNTNGLTFSDSIRKKMSNSHIGIPHGSRDNIIYEFKNLDTGTIEHWTRHEFYKTVGADPCKLVIGKAQSVRQWVCLSVRSKLLRQYPNRK